MAAQTQGIAGPIGELPQRVAAAQLGLREAWERVRVNGGMPGVDNVGVARFARARQSRLRALQSDLARGAYLPLPLRLCEIAKPDGRSRLLLVPAVTDRVAQSAVAQWIGSKFERHADPASYAYRAGRGVND